MPLIIDSFAGGGGASTGIEAALGRSPDVAINHDAKALAMHAANHPETVHLDSNIWEVEPTDIAKGRPVGLLWASPDCKHFSKAKGGAPRDRNIRDLAWVVVKWAEQVKPDVILMENVEEFLTWGPVGEDGQPIKEFAGMTFELWVKRLRKAGYKVQWRELRGCDYGAPTIRKRFFMVARRDGRRISWPKPTHGAPDCEDVKQGKLKPWRTAAECIDWSIPCPSIFDTTEEIKEKHGLRAKRPLAPNTLARVARGMKRYVLDAKRPFIVNLTHGARTEDVADPFKTVTGANRGEKAVVAPTITRFNSGATGQDVREPLQTITANSFIKRPGGAAPIGLLAPHLMTMRNAQKPFNGADEPTHTITAGGAGLSLIAPNLLSLKGSARRDFPADSPHPTVLAGGGHSALVAPVLTYAQHGGANRAPVDPMHTICANRKDQNSISAAFFAKYYGKEGDPQMVDPLHTITTKDRFGHFEAKLSAPVFGPDHEHKARAVAEFLRSQGAWKGGEFVTLEIDGETFVIVDIGMRMLSPRELFSAQGFPPDYVIEGTWENVSGEWKWQPFTKSTQVSCCGNSVCPDVAEALVYANCQHLAQEARAA